MPHEAGKTLVGVWKAAITLIGVIVATACAGSQAARSVKPVAPGDSAAVRTAPAAGLWSHRFVRWPDGTITAVGFSRKPAGVEVVRYSSKGQLDRSARRIVHSEFGADKLDALAAVRAGPRTLLVAACQPPDCGGYLVLGRFQRDGSLDASFGDVGLLRTSASSGSLEPRALAIQRDGKILVAGELWTGSARRAFVARYLPDGSVTPISGNKALWSATSSQRSARLRCKAMAGSWGRPDPGSRATWPTGRWMLALGQAALRVPRRCCTQRACC
jgi:hypothetical protein